MKTSFDIEAFDTEGRLSRKDARDFNFFEEGFETPHIREPRKVRVFLGEPVKDEDVVIYDYEHQPPVADPVTQIERRNAVQALAQIETLRYWL